MHVHTMTVENRNEHQLHTNTGYGARTNGPWRLAMVSNGKMHVMESTFEHIRGVEFQHCTTYVRETRNAKSEAHLNSFVIAALLLFFVIDLLFECSTMNIGKLTPLAIGNTSPHLTW